VRANVANTSGIVRNSAFPYAKPTWAKLALQFAFQLCLLLTLEGCLKKGTIETFFFRNIKVNYIKVYKINDAQYYTIMYIHDSSPLFSKLGPINQSSGEKSDVFSIEDYFDKILRM
jgi:hypothetical protein